MKLNRLVDIDYKHKSNSLTEGYALFINMDHKHGFSKQVPNFPIEQMLCIDAYGINYVYQKMESQGNIAYLYENKIIMILMHLQIFVSKMTSKSRRFFNIDTRSES